ncbi:MAG: hybrid sensor histidine kinase/response regulator [Methylobacteriaceae bacterium]|nr:hybrid sensor histidine kinase/response regulator [Methylobacteriaceae bacterium]
MIPGWAAILAALLYLSGLFAVAYYGDTLGRRLVRERARGLIYALTLAVYCTSWTFFGSVGLASTAGLDFLPIYIGPIVVVAFGQRLILRMVRLAKSQNITSIADFIAARYGKSEAVAALVAIIAVIGVVPYIALQLKAISASLATVLKSASAGHVVTASTAASGSSVIVALILAGFAMAFGTRRIDATEHQDGLMFAIAVESLVKLVSFLAVGLYVTFGMFHGFGDLAARVEASEPMRAMLLRPPQLGTWLTMNILSAAAILLLPRQFHVTIVENRDTRDVRTAGWLFPLYLVAINIFVVPIVIAGLSTFPEGAINRDMTVLSLPIQGGASLVTLIAMIGGLSAATAMVIVACVALSIMVSNDLVIPLLLRGRARLPGGETGDLSLPILTIRRAAIVVIICLGYIYFRAAGDAALASIGLLSFAAIAQIVPAFVGALAWRRGTARGAMAGLAVGIALWTYTLFLPSLEAAPEWLRDLIEHGPVGIEALRPTALFGLQLAPLTHGVFVSLIANIAALVGVSLLRRPSPIEDMQASVFVGTREAPMVPGFRLWRASVTTGEIESTVARYLGAERTRRAFDDFFSTHDLPRAAETEADPHLLRFAEHLLAAALGAPSSRLVLSLLLRRRLMSTKAALKLLDDASAAIQYNRDLLQHALDHARQGITVFDRGLRLMCWNREFQTLFDLPGEMLRAGIRLEQIIRFNAERGLYGPGPADAFIATRLESLTREAEPFRLRLRPSARVIEIRSARMPDEGIVTTYTDVTESVAAEEALAATNETLEQRVNERTEELVRLNQELGRAKMAADEANTSKTRFLAAASHDILQPLNAARLYTTTLVERADTGLAGSNHAALARNIDASLEAVEEILMALLDISRLDAGALKPELTTFPIDQILRHLQLEFEPLAREKGLRLSFVGSSCAVRSDRRLLRRLLQNLVSNAIKYTLSGRVLVGCRRHRGRLQVQVWDTGIGIPVSRQKHVFREFERLDQGAKVARGLGLGLSIVERIGRILGHRITLTSTPGKGSMFAVDLPAAGRMPATGLVSDGPKAIPARPFSDLCVLAIDNEARILEGMETLLAGWGCTVIKATHLEEAEQVLRASRLRPDAIIADYHLDQGDGMEAIAALRWRLGPNLFAVLLTADRSQEVRRLAGAKAIHVLHKPLKPAALRGLLAQWRARQTAAE